MPLDAITLTAVTEELSRRAVGMKIDKVQQPERDVIILSLRGMGENFRLLVSAGVGTARVHVTNASFENPQTPPMFCMLLRKHLQGARIASVTQPEMERLVIFELDAFDEMGVAVVKRVVVEMMGRNSNIILTDSDWRIIDCLRRMDGGDEGEKRRVLPGMFYTFPQTQRKADFFLSTSEERKRLFTAAPEGKAADKWLLDTFFGLSPLICREICFRCFGDTSPMIGRQKWSVGGDFCAALDALAECVKNREFVPCMMVENDRPREFSFMPIKQYGDAVKVQEFSDFSSLLDAFYTRREKLERVRHRAHTMIKTVKTARDRAVRKISAQRQELLRTESREVKKRFGDLITANMYRMKKGEAELVTEDFYEDTCPRISIPLDPLKTPQQNAAAYYKEYNKLKAAVCHLTEQIELGEQAVEYLESVLEEIDRAEGERDLGDIRRELTASGYIRSQRNARREKIPESKPLKFISSSGMEIYVGRNNQQNDTLTTKYARRTDMWLHAQKIHGSHVIISCEDAQPDEQTLLEAAMLAAYYSKGRSGGKTAVDYTQVRFVKKPSGALPGKVIYTDYKTIIVDADEKLAEQLKVKL